MKINKQLCARLMDLADIARRRHSGYARYPSKENKELDYLAWQELKYFVRETLEKHLRQLDGKHIEQDEPN